jgi:hypothetical protein
VVLSVSYIHARVSAGCQLSLDGGFIEIWGCVPGRVRVYDQHWHSHIGERGERVDPRDRGPFHGERVAQAAPA